MSDSKAEAGERREEERRRASHVIHVRGSGQTQWSDTRRGRIGRYKETRIQGRKQTEKREYTREWVWASWRWDDGALRFGHLEGPGLHVVDWEVLPPLVDL